MNLERVGSVAMRALLLQVLGQVDNVDGLKWAFLEWKKQRKKCRKMTTQKIDSKTRQDERGMLMTFGMMNRKNSRRLFEIIVRSAQCVI